MLNHPDIKSGFQRVFTMKHRVYENRVRVGFTVMTVIMGCIIFAAFWLSQEREAMYSWVTNARAVRTSIRELRADLIEAESNQRGYILTGGEEYSLIHDRACARIQVLLHNLEHLASENAHLQEVLPTLDSDINRWIRESKQAIQLRRDGYITQARSRVGSGTGKNTFDRITRRLQDTSNEEDRLLSTQTQTWNAYSRYLAWAIYTLAFVLLGLLWLAYRALRTAGRKDAMFEAATEGSMDGFMLLETVRGAKGRTVDFVVLDVNRRARTLTGRSAGRVIGRRLTHVLPPELRESVVSRYIKAIDTAQVLEEEFPADPARPEERWLRHQVVPVNDGVAVTFRDVTEQKNLELQLIAQQVELMNANTRLEALATTDYLTDLKNSRAFHEKLQEEVVRASRYGEALSLMIIDVDRFKQYNDTLGHPAGDGALREIAGILGSNARTTDFVARYGGEEFAIILPQTDREGATEAAERLRRAIEQHNWKKQRLTSSFGVATFHKAINSGTRLISAADKAMYASKSRGRNLVTHADDLRRRSPRPVRGRIRIAI